MPKKGPPRASIPTERIEKTILLIRGQKVMLDADLADLYGVETKYLVRQVKRNIERFPEDFMFQLSNQEFTDLKCQLGTSSSWGGRRTLPYAFSEQGIAMLSSVLRSSRAVAVNIEIMRAFVRLRKLMASHKQIAQKLADFDQRLGKHDLQFQAVFEAIQRLLEPATAEEKRRRIGFGRQDEGD